MEEHDTETQSEAWYRPLTTAFQTLTSLPFRGPCCAQLGDSLRWFSTVGFALGILVLGLGLFAFWLSGGWAAGTAFAMLVASVMLTRALHLDGVSDWADGFWGGYERERILEIMKDSSLGTFGTCALVCVLLGKWVALSRLVQNGAWGMVVIAFVVSRTMQVVLAASQPYARSTTGTGSPFIENAQQRDVHVAMAIAVLLCLLCWLASPCLPFLALPLVIGGAWGSTWAFGAWCKRRVGGVTGDLLGACSELTELLVLLAGGAFVRS